MKSLEKPSEKRPIRCETYSQSPDKLHSRLMLEPVQVLDKIISKRSSKKAQVLHTYGPKNAIQKLWFSMKVFHLIISGGVVAICN